MLQSAGRLQFALWTVQVVKYNFPLLHVQRSEFNSSYKVSLYDDDDDDDDNYNAASAVVDMANMENTIKLRQLNSVTSSMSI